MLLSNFNLHLGRSLASVIFTLVVCWGSTGWSQTVIYENNFDDDPTGQYTITNLNADWNTPPFDNGVEEGRVSIVDNSEAFSGNSLAVEYPAGLHRSSATGAQWQLKFGQDYEEVTLEYRVKFRAGFDFVRGGKLPGLIGGTANTGGNRPDGTDGFSARMHWRTDGSSGSPLTSERANITQYLYHVDQPNSTGQDFRWDDSESADWELFESGRWYHLRHRVVMNSVVNGVGQNDGIVQAWLDGKLVLDLNNIRFRDIETLKIDGFYFSTFFGGSGNQWNTSKDEVALFDDFKISVPVLLGDINLDGSINFFDISPFISILTLGGYQDEADLNQNMAVNFFDISPFIELLSSP